MRTLLMFVAIIGGALLIFIGGAAFAFGGAGGGVGGAIRELAMGLPGGPSVWSSPGMSVGAGIVAILVGIWLSRS